MNEPYIVLCDGEKDLDQRLMNALRSTHGQSVTVFVRDHQLCGDTVVVLLPEKGPSLAAALRDWVASWWSEGDDQVYGSPTAYLQGFGVVIDSDEWSTFSTSCPYCGHDGVLSIESGIFQAMDVSIGADGFALADASMLQTEDETIRCGACGRTFSADAIRL